MGVQTTNGNSGRLRRVLYVTDLHPSLKFGSLDEQIFVLARAFKERGSLFVPVFGEALEAEATSRYENAGLPAETLNLYRFTPAALRQLLRLIRRYSIELIDWNFYGPVNPYLLSLSLLAPAVEHYYTVHSLPLNRSGPSGGVKQIVKKILLKRYRKVLCITDFLVDYLAEQKIWSNVSRCHFFVNTNRFQPDPVVRGSLRKQMDVEERFVILTVGSLIPEKGVAVMIRALAELPDSATLWIVGDGREAERLQALCDELSVSSRVRFFGQQQDVSPYMKAADCFVCPSIKVEGMGFVNLEALGSQLPVIGSDIGGIPELLEHGRTGFLFSPGDHRQLADLITQLINDPEKHRWMGLQAREAAIERFSSESRLPDYLQLYRTEPGK